MRLVLILLVFLYVCSSIETGIASRSEETTVSYNVTTGDVFPEMTDMNASIICLSQAVFNSSDDTVLPNGSTEYSLNVSPESGNLTVNYNIDSPLIKKTGSSSVSFNPIWLVGDSPPITVYEDEVIKITVTIHGHINGHITTIGNGSVTPSEITWSTWETKVITVSANASAENGQTIQIQTATKYVVYFTVSIELIGIEVLTGDSPTEAVSGSPMIQYPIHVIPEFPSFLILPLFMIATLLAVIVYRRKNFV